MTTSRGDYILAGPLAMVIVMAIFQDMGLALVVGFTVAVIGASIADRDEERTK